MADRVAVVRGKSDALNLCTTGADTGAVGVCSVGVAIFSVDAAAISMYTGVVNQGLEIHLLRTAVNGDGRQEEDLALEKAVGATRY